VGSQKNSSMLFRSPLPATYTKSDRSRKRSYASE
jgi:hypothetical protein